MTRWAACLALLCLSSTAAAQDAAPSLHPAALGATYDEAFLRDLPLSDSLYSLLDVVQPSLIADRFTEGGLFTGRAARVGGFQASWTQTRFRLGDVDLTDPRGTGAPLVVPDLGPWRSVRVATGLIGNDVNTTGLAVTLEPRVAAAAWTQAASASLSHGGLAGHASTLAQPTIARLAGRDRLEWTAAGPIDARTGASIALSWTRASQFDRAVTPAATGQVGSAFVALTRRGRGDSRLDTIGWVQRARTPSPVRLVFAGGADATATDTGVHVQSTWRTAPTRSWPWRAFASYTQRAQSTDLTSTLAVMDRLLDGPVSSIATPDRGTVRQWSLGSRTERRAGGAGARHRLSAGADLTGAGHRTPAQAALTVGERTDGVASRVWQYAATGGDSRRHAYAAAVHVNDAIALSPRTHVTAGLRLDAVSGAAAGADRGVRWISLLPRARVDWRLHQDGAASVFVGYNRSAYHLALDLLAVGDPAAPVATLHRWDSARSVTAAATDTVVARVGPGTGGNPDFARIDDGLRRPVSDELAFGFEIQPATGTRIQLAAVGRRETGFIGLADVGAPASAYSVSTVNDPGSNTGSPDDDKVISIFSRLPATFGADRYVLTNTDADASLSGNLELSGQWTTPRLTFFGGATASIAQGPATNRGYGALENDQSVLPDAFVTPNGDTFARGRLFNDRAFTIKLSGVYRLPWDIRAGAIARYQDGQPFSRMLVFPALPQGAEAVRAFAAGDSRFRFVGTLDVRVSKGFMVGGRRVEAVLDAYNLPGLTYDVEERAAALPDDRTPIAIQPSRAIHVGLRAVF